MEEITDFKTFLVSKKVDAGKFEKAESDLFNEWKSLFSQVSPASFSAQKLFLINPIRRKYHLKEAEVVVQAKPKMAAKPKFKRP